MKTKPEATKRDIVPAPGCLVCVNGLCRGREVPSSWIRFGRVALIDTEGHRADYIIGIVALSGRFRFFLRVDGDEPLPEWKKVWDDAGPEFEADSTAPLFERLGIK